MTKKNYAVFIFRASGAVEKTIQPKKPSYEQLSKAVGGYIENIPYFTRYGDYKRGMAYANEEGIIHRLPMNHKATRAWQDSVTFPLSQGLAGDVIFYAVTEEEI